MWNLYANTIVESQHGMLLISLIRHPLVPFWFGTKSVGMAVLYLEKELLDANSNKNQPRPGCTCSDIQRAHQNNL